MGINMDLDINSNKIIVQIVKGPKNIKSYIQNIKKALIRKMVHYLVLVIKIPSINDLYLLRKIFNNYLHIDLDSMMFHKLEDLQ